ncbi:MAG: ParB N-terminal domain-containing protein [Pirellulales bacterium]|nr:ParB N-terminal domain-containing protein [Pirellulales bacterium]
MFRDRIKELRRVPAAALRPNPRNWRRHPAGQRAALRAMLDEVGFADALLARELLDGSLELVDGHLRAETAADDEVPVLVLDLEESEADKLLALLDPLAALAETDQVALGDLSARLELESEALGNVLASILDEPSVLDAARHEEPETPVVPESFVVAIECDDEGEQRRVYERMREEGYRCRVLTL